MYLEEVINKVKNNYKGKNKLEKVITILEALLFNGKINPNGQIKKKKHL